MSQFFDELAESAYIETFARESATLRFDVRHGKEIDRWRVTVHDGTVSVSHADEPADAVVKIEQPQLEQIVSGRLNAQAANLRGLLTCEGDLSALMMFQRCLPGPPGSTGRVAPISGQQVMAERRPA